MEAAYCEAWSQRVMALVHAGILHASPYLSPEMRLRVINDLICALNRERADLLKEVWRSELKQ